MLVSDSDQRILSFLAKFRFVPVEIIRAELFAHQRASSVKPYVSRRLKHLRDLGFVQSEYVLGKSQVHSLTPAGAEFMGVEGGSGAGVKLAEYAHELLLFLDLLLVKDSAKLIEGVLCVTTQLRDILRRILPDVDRSLCNGRRCPAACIAFDGHGDIRCKAFGVVDLILFILRHVVIVAVLMVGGTDALCTVIRLILQIAEGECAGREFVLVGRCFCLR